MFNSHQGTPMSSCCSCDKGKTKLTPTLRLGLEFDNMKTCAQIFTLLNQQSCVLGTTHNEQYQKIGHLIRTSQQEQNLPITSSYVGVRKDEYKGIK